VRAGSRSLDLVDPIVDLRLARRSLRGPSRVSDSTVQESNRDTSFTTMMYSVVYVLAATNYGEIKLTGMDARAMERS